MADDGKIKPLHVSESSQEPQAMLGARRVSDDGEWLSSATLFRFFSTLRRRWFLIAVTVLAFAVAGGVFAISAVPRYEAVGVVQVSSGEGLLGASSIVDLTGAGSAAEIQTEVEIMRRREFLVEVLKNAGLNVQDPSEARSFSTDLGVTLGGESPVSEQTRNLRAALTSIEVDDSYFDPVQISIDERDGDLYLSQSRQSDESISCRVVPGTSQKCGLVKFKIGSVSPTGAIEGDYEVLPDGELYDRFSDQVSVRSLGSLREQTNLVEVRVRSSDRSTAKKVVSEILDRYLSQSIEWQSSSASQAADFISERLAEARKKMLESEELILDFAERNQSVQLDTQARVAIERAAELETRRLTLELQERTISSVRARLLGAKPGVSADLTANFFEDPVLATSIAGLTEAETRYQVLRGTLTDTHPQVARVKRELEEHRDELKKLLRSAERTIKQQREELDRELAETAEKMSEFPSQQLELARLTRDLEVSQQLYTLLLERLQEAQVVKASTTTDKRVVDAPALPHEAASPNRVKVGAGFVGLGFVFGIGLALGVSSLQRKLDTVDSIRETISLPVYGMIPVHELGDAQQAVSVFWQETNRPVPEAFRSLGVSVSLLPVTGVGGRVISVTSSQPGEGKSTVASNLAVALSRAGRSVLVVDLDLRKPVQHRLWEGQRSPGYSDLLGAPQSSADTADFISEGIAGVKILTAGTKLADTVGAILTERLRELVEAWRGDFDYIVLDNPPAFVAETRAAIKNADLVLLVARPGVSERQNVRHAVESLDGIDVAKGLVINAVTRTSSGYGAGYHYYYGQAYGEDSDVRTGT